MNDEDPDKRPTLEISATRLFPAWMKQQRTSLAFTTYQAGKLFFIGLNDRDELSIFERSFPRCMGLARGAREELWLATLYQLWRFENFLDPGQKKDGYDAFYVPVVGHTTGDLDTHDTHCDAAGRPIFVATRFNCLATIDERSSFRELWRPPFIDRLAAEDRCHLNGYAMADGAPKYATCVARTNVADGWRQHRNDGGLVIDVETGEVVAEGLSMPHSPRLHQGRLWLIQSGTGEFGEIDLATGAFRPVAFLPGFARGLDFVGDYAVIGVSKPRKNRTFDGLRLNDRLEAEKIDAECMIAVVNLATGDVEHRLSIDGVVSELFEAVALPGIRRPMALGFKSDEIRFAVRPAAGQGGD